MYYASVDEGEYNMEDLNTQYVLDNINNNIIR